MGTENETTEAVWLRNPRTGVVNLVVHPETIRRCLSEGHVAVPDPRLPVTADAPTDAPTDTLAGTDTITDADMQAAVAALTERNNAARAAFGVAPRQPAQPAAKPVRRASPRPARPPVKGA